MPFTFIRRRSPEAGDAPGAPARRRVFTARFFLAAGLFAAVYALSLFGLSLTSPQPFEGLSEGQRAPATVVAQVDFACRDFAATDARKRQAAEDVRPVFDVRGDAAEDALRTLSRLADRARARRADLEKAAAAAPAPVPAVLPPPEAPEEVPEAPQTAEKAPEDPETALSAAPEGAEDGEADPTAGKKAKKRKKRSQKAEKSENPDAKAIETAEKAPESAENGEKSADAAEKTPETAEIAPETALPPAVPLPLPLPAPAVSTQETFLANLADAAAMLDVPLSGEALAALFPAGREAEVLAVLSDVLRQIAANGLATPSERESGFNGLASEGEVALAAPGGGYLLRPLATLATPEEAAAAFGPAAQAALAAIGVDCPAATLSALAAGKLEGDLAYNPAATAAARAAASGGVPQVPRAFRAGDTLMEEGQKVTPQTLEILSAHAQAIAARELPAARRRHAVARALVLAIALAVSLAWECGTRRDAKKRGVSEARRPFFLAFLALFTVALALAGRALCASQEALPMWLLPYVLPLAAPAILAALFSGRATGFAAALWLGLFSELLFGKTGGVSLPAFAAAAAATLALGEVHKRSQIMRAGLLSGLAAALVAGAYAVVSQPPPAAIAAQTLSALAGGFFSGAFAGFLLPACEWMCDCTSGVTLLELTDAGHPLLRRLAVEAPGTYHHSLMVAALASAAAAKVGADELEVAVDAYFHDVGKLAKPEFFTENQRGGANPHDELAPAMSALIIQSHVKEGLSLAKRHRLPRVVREAIACHHGTALAGFFYQLAKKEAGEAGLPDDPALEAGFRYEGPRPRTKEHAILMLADGVEAASRSLEKPTPQRIRSLVERMTADRVADGQLDECPLSLGEIALVRESLVFSLWNMHHGRTPYPPRHPDRAPAKA